MRIVSIAIALTTAFISTVLISRLFSVVTEALANLPH